jgi:hypothetical protein
MPDRHEFTVNVQNSKELLPIEYGRQHASNIAGFSAIRADAALRSRRLDLKKQQLKYGHRF